MQRSGTACEVSLILKQFPRTTLLDFLGQSVSAQAGLSTETPLTTG